MNLQKDIGKQLKQIREQQGKTQQDVADKTGNHKQYISQIERGVKFCSLKKLQEIAKALDSTVTVKIERMRYNRRKGIDEPIGLN